MTDDSIRFNRQTWRRFVAITMPLFTSELRWKARGMLLLLAAFSVSVIGMNVVMSYVGRDFINALALKQRDEFYKQLVYYLASFALATPFVVFYRYTEERLGLMWRRWLSHHLLQRYLTNRSFYKLNWSGGIDNPDQRIAEDIRSFTTSTLSFLLIIFNSLIQVLSFTKILWSISAALTFSVFAYALFGSITTYFLGRPLIGLNFKQFKKEADYRYKLINIRDNAESIAFTRGEPQEFTRTRQRLKLALDNLLSIINWNRNVNFFSTGYNYVLIVLPTVIVAPLYFDGEIEYGVIGQAAGAFGVVLSALSIIVNNFSGLSSFAAVVTRLGTFCEALDSVQHSDGHSRIRRTEGDSVSFEGVTIVTPRRDQVLLRDVTFKLEGRSLLISGPSGSGKSSVLRAVAGLWDSGSGTVISPPAKECFFMPQRPYMVLGSLRSQLVYGIRKHGILDREIEAVLAKVHLEGMVARVGGLDTVQDWPSLLATGEQQRLAFARLLLAKPCFAFLDEATTAVDPDTEELLYKLLLEQVQAYASVGHQSSVGKFHDMILHLRGDGTAFTERRNTA